jgi:hypothetical protein
MRLRWRPPVRRRNFLGLSAALLASQMARLRESLAAGTVEKGIYRVRGDVKVNGIAAVEGMEIKAGDVITTGANGEAVFVSGKDAFLVRANARVEAQGGAAGELALSGLRLATGALLSVFSPGAQRSLRTATATIGIRGTAVYLEAAAARTYVCVCYGVADLAAVSDPSARETVQTQHHEAPRYIMGSGAPQMLMGAPVINHTDAELIMLESLVGRRPPFESAAGYRRERY